MNSIALGFVWAAGIVVMAVDRKSWRTGGRDTLAYAFIVVFALAVSATLLLSPKATYLTGWIEALYKPLGDYLKPPPQT
ncbi:hypothetical protein ACFFNY_03415 [Paenibacillus hodogayensis]|uniref:Uncharacterized protein n=1 Tax=Paenibacillus hodogayensis TaxID=279208 RepID=A0ABV5VQR2_9BACL